MFTITANKNMKRRLGEGVSGKASKVQRIMSSLPDRMLHKAQAMQAEARPDNTIKEHTGCTAMEFPSYSDLGDFFHAPTQAEIDAYQHDILAAVRTSQIDTLREFHAAGRPMKCSNEFGESILHLACRKGLCQVAKFLIQEAGVPVQVCDDYGRNPLHDACWVHKPNFELMDLVLSKCPDLLFIKDRRGHTPLSFARRDQWKSWNDYLKSKSPEFLKPTTLLQRQQGSTANASTSSNTDSKTNTPSSIVAATAPAPSPIVTAKRLSASVAAKGISLPTFSRKVAASGIKIPGVTDVTASTAPPKAAPRPASAVKVATAGGVKLPTGASAGVKLPNGPVLTTTPVLKLTAATSANQLQPAALAPKPAIHPTLHPGAPAHLQPLKPLVAIPPTLVAAGAAPPTLASAAQLSNHTPPMIKLPNGTIVTLPPAAAIAKAGINVLLEAAKAPPTAAAVKPADPPAGVAPNSPAATSG